MAGKSFNSQLTEISPTSKKTGGKGFLEVLADIQEDKEGRGPLKRFVMGALAIPSLLTGCGAVEEKPKEEPKEEVRQDIDEDFNGYVQEFKDRAPGCNVPPILKKRPSWNDDKPLATTSAMRDFVWVDQDQYANLSDKQREALVLHELGHINYLEHPDGVRRGDKIDDIMQPFGDSKHIDEWDMEEKKKAFFDSIVKKCATNKGSK